MKTEYMFSLSDTIDREKYVIATYCVDMDNQADILKRSAQLAVGQTIGTWTHVGGLTEALFREHVGRVVGVFDVPAEDIVADSGVGTGHYIVQIAFPADNLGGQLSMLLTTLLGNDASTSMQAKLVDIQFPRSFADTFCGPRFGIEGLRELTGVYGRPLLLNMIKPCTGLSPEEGADIFYRTALGGVDLIKDDELMGGCSSFSSACARAEMYRKAAERAYEQTGKRTLYIANITQDGSEMLSSARRAVELGADAVMVNFAVVGYGLLHELARSAGVPIVAHYAASGMVYENSRSGMSSPLSLGKLVRLAGADAVVINSPYGGYPMKHQKYIQTVHALTLPFLGKLPSMPVVGGKLHPGTVKAYIDELGCDIILGAGGAVQGHPGGAAAGIHALQQAIDAAINNIDIQSCAREHPELRAALDLWGPGV